VLVHGDKSDAEGLRTEIGQVLRQQLKMTLSEEKTHITHIDDGFVFLGFRIQRRLRGNGSRVVLTIPSKQALAGVMHKIKQATKTGTSRTLGQVRRRTTEPTPSPPVRPDLLGQSRAAEVEEKPDESREAGHRPKPALSTCVVLVGHHPTADHVMHV
jgi:hypothetical protein